MVRRLAVVVVSLLLATGAARADGGFVHAFIGGWAYDVTGTTETTSRLDFEDDLGLRSTDRKSYALGITPAQPGWLPALEFDYTRIAADGRQTVSLLPFVGAEPVPGALPVSTTVQIDDRTRIQDAELSARWPYRWNTLSLAGGFSLAWVKGSVTVADSDTGQQQRQPVNQVFPLLSLAAQWQPTAALRFTLSGDYVQYKGNRADEIEARVLWKFLGPVGLQGGYLRRRYKITEPDYRLNAQVGGARIGVVIEIPY